MEFWQYSWYLLTAPWQIAANIAFSLTIILGFIVWRKPKWERKTKLLLWMVPLFVFLLVTPITLVKTSYDLYEETMQEHEQNRPMLVLDNDIMKVNTIEEKQKVSIDIALVVQNMSDSPAYNTRIRLCAAPLDYPQNIGARSDIYQTNPIFAGVNKILSFNYQMDCVRGNGDYIVPSEMVLIYVNLRYSNAASDGIWYEEPWWIVFDINSGHILDASPEQVETFKPFVDEHYAGSP